MNVRKGAGKSTEVKSTVNRGGKLKSSKRSGDWLYFPALKGWIRRISATKELYLKQID